jgi:hypothetical protein
MNKFAKEDKQWSEAVKKQDNQSCAICNSKVRPNAHHLIPKEITQMRHDRENGITLCPLHHRFSREISAHQNPIAFLKWMELNRVAQYNYVKYKA